ncbi:MAG: DUF4381 domain-containing protein [Pseudomonadota bacterium]
MTPQEILRDLRDIHIPEQAAEAAALGIVLWPGVVVIVLALFAGLIVWRRRSAWRRDTLKHLDTIERRAFTGQIQEEWMALAILLRRIAIKTSDRRHDVASLVGRAWLAKLDQMFDTETFFEHGPGRAIIDVPYAHPGPVGCEKDVQHANDLIATIANIRRRLPYLRSTR